MKNRTCILSIKHFVFLYIVLFLPSIVLYATTHVINFGGTVGNNYSPSNLNVSVGDTVTWQGTFTTHPLSSTMLPPGATSFHNGSGTSFSYLVQVPGNYNYECDVHAFLGMTGSFSATISSVEEDGFSAQPATFRLDQNHPNPFNPTTTIGYFLPITGEVDLSVYNLLGQKIETLVSKRQQAGQHQVQWDAGQNASGVYYYLIKTGEFQDVKMMTLVR
jgi:plastocyanin